MQSLLKPGSPQGAPVCPHHVLQGRIPEPVSKGGRHCLFLKGFLGTGTWEMAWVDQPGPRVPGLPSRMARRPPRRSVSPTALLGDFEVKCPVRAREGQGRALRMARQT